jgi:hypothetical protein
MPTEPQQAKQPKDWLDADIVEALAKDILPTFHAELVEAKIKFYFVTEHSMKGGRPIFGKARKLSGATQFLAGGYNFAIEIAMDLFNAAEPAVRRARLDHLLECCTGIADEQTGAIKYTMREPDVKEFSSILRRHGAYTDDLMGLVQVAQTLQINARVQEVLDVTAAEDIEEEEERVTNAAANH